MTTFDQGLTGGYVAAGSDRSDLDPCAVCVGDTIRALFNADKKFGIDPTGNGSLAEFVDANAEHLEHIANDVRKRPVLALPITGGETA